MCGRDLWEVFPNYRTSVRLITLTYVNLTSTQPIKLLTRCQNDSAAGSALKLSEASSMSENETKPAGPEGDVFRHPSTQDALEIPSLHCNLFNVAAGPVTVRITFGEGLGPGTHGRFRSSVSLPTTDALLLASLIVETVQKNQSLAADLATKDATNVDSKVV